MSGTNEADEYYFNTRTNMVEHGRLSPWEHLLGPYETREDAEKALETAQVRSTEWDDDDLEWDGEWSDDEDSREK